MRISIKCTDRIAATLPSHVAHGKKDVRDRRRQVVQILYWPGSVPGKDHVFSWPLTRGPLKSWFAQDARTALAMASPTSVLLQRRERSVRGNCPVTALRKASRKSFSVAGSNILMGSNSSGAHPAYCEQRTGKLHRTASLATNPQTSSIVGKIKT